MHSPSDLFTDAPGNECKIHLTHDSKFLYLIDRGMDGDIMKVLDIYHNGAVMKNQATYVDIKSIKLLGKDR